MTESEYIRFWKSVHALATLQTGQSIVLDWLGERRRFVRARDEKGRFTGTQRDTVAGWVRRMEKDRNYKGYLKRVLKEIFILQLLSGRIGHKQPQYSQKYRKRKEDWAADRTTLMPREHTRGNPRGTHPMGLHLSMRQSSQGRSRCATARSPSIKRVSITSTIRARAWRSSTRAARPR